MLGSMEPMEPRNAAQLAAQMPESARQDLLEWNTEKTAPEFLSLVLDHEYPVAGLVNRDPAIQVTDDQPYNEYYLLRRAAASLQADRETESK